MKTQSINQQFIVFTLIITLMTLSVQGVSYGQNLNAGESRTVRMIYFLPNDLPYRSDVVQNMKDDIRTVQTFFADQMEAHGYGKKTFRFETDDEGEPKVHRVDGIHPFRSYDNTLGNAVIDELEQTFNLDANIYFIVLGADALRQGNGLPAGGVASQRGKNGGTVLVPNRFGRFTVAHELGHTFGLGHDFRDNSYLMSYGPRQDVSLSACATELLAVNPYFDLRIPIAKSQSPTIELTSSPTYPAGSRSITVRLKVKDLEGIHQVQLHAWGGLQDCRGLAGKKEAVVEFEYDGGIGLLDFDSSRVDFTSLTDASAHNILVQAVDTDGNVSATRFILSEISPFVINSFKGHTDIVSCVAFSPDGSTFASVSYDNTVKLWTVGTGANIATFKHTRRVKTVLFSPDGMILASGGNDGIKLWDLATKQNIANLPHGDFVNSVAFSPDGTILASGGDNGLSKLWNVETRREIDTIPHEGDQRFVGSVAFSPDGTMLASGCWNGDIKLRDVAAKQTIATIRMHGNVNSVAFSPDGTMLASGTAHGDIGLWDVTSRHMIDTINGHWTGFSPTSMSFSPDGTMLTAGNSGGGEVGIWNVATGSRIIGFPHPSGVKAVAFSPDGTILASGTFDGTVNLWDVASFLSQESASNTKQIIISEIMYASNGGQLPQWIELSNPSKTDVINLKGWKLEIQNYRSKNFNGQQNITIALNEKFIEPQRTLLIVSKQGRSSKQLGNKQVHNLNLQESILSDEGFYIKLSNISGELIDEVGNLDGKRNNIDELTWRLPTSITKDGARSSMIRRQDDLTPLLGTEASGWISAKNTKLAAKTTHYYGHPHDIGAPGIGSGEALPVTLSRFRADRMESGVVIKWTTEAEVDNAGFYILRSDIRDGIFKVVNPQLIQGAGTTSERNEYMWTDTTAKQDTVYYYRIEDVSHAGVREQLATVRLSGFVSAKGKLTTSWGDLKMAQ